MTILRVVSELIARFRAQRWSKEVLLAIVLTLAAAAFIAAAVSGHGPQGQSHHVQSKALDAAADR